MRKAIIAVLVVLAVVVLAGCWAGENPQVGVADEAGRLAGFGLGLWHGIIAPVAFVVSLFTDKVHVFEVHNSGNWYVFGFLLGLLAIWGGGGLFARRRR